MKQRVMGIRYSGAMMSPTVAPDSFWPVVDTLEEQLDNGRALYRSARLAEIDPDHAEHLTGKFAWSGFCQGWLGMLPAEAAEQLLDRAGEERVRADPGGGRPAPALRRLWRRVQRVARRQSHHLRRVRPHDGPRQHRDPLRIVRRDDDPASGRRRSGLPVLPVTGRASRDPLRPRPSGQHRGRQRRGARQAGARWVSARPPA